MNEYIIAIILGIIEGATEFLPVSSTGHMILAGSMMGFTGEVATVFEVVIQFGAILSVLFIYRDRYLNMLRPKAGGKHLTMMHVAAGIIPVMGIAYVLHSPIKEYLFSPMTVIMALIVGGLFMLFAEKVSKEPRITDVDQLTVKEATLVGIFQVLSLWPGFSRSGSTIAGGLLLGLSRKAAADFSFIIAAPLMFVACSYDFLKIYDKLSMDDIAMFAVGFVTAFIFAYVSVIWFLKFLNNSSLASFAYYRFLLAAVSYYYFFF